MKLFKTILLLMLVTSLVPTVMVGLLSVSNTRELLVRDAQELAQERVKQLKLKSEGFLAEPTRAVMGLAGGPNFFAQPLQQQQTYLRAVLNQRREVQALTVFDAEGKRLPGLQAFAVSDVPPTALAEHEARAVALLEDLRDLRYADVVWRPSGEAVVTFTFPIGEPIKGYVAADVSLAELQAMIAQERVGSTGFVYLADAKGRVIAAGGGLQANQDVSQRPVVAHLLQGVARSPDTDILHVGNFSEGDEAVVAAYATLADPHWAIVSEQPVALAYKQVETMERLLLLTVLSATLVALGLAAFFSRSVTRPLKGFTQGALELAQGKFGHEVNVPQKNELGELARTFNYMSKQLLAYDHENRRLYESL
ncbi:MAG TPA: cache domain-containing protein, partial [Myxococcaceae bacterium]|nr:cache domain-containing protein [Myxococcaceae bacterium]